MNLKKAYPLEQGLGEIVQIGTSSTLQKLLQALPLRFCTLQIVGYMLQECQPYNNSNANKIPQGSQFPHFRGEERRSPRLHPPVAPLAVV